MIDYSKYYIDDDGDVSVRAQGREMYTVIYRKLYILDDEGWVIDCFDFVFNMEIQEKAHHLCYIGI